MITIMNMFNIIVQHTIKIFKCPFVVVVVPTPTPKHDGGANNVFYSHRSAAGIPHISCIRSRWSTGGPSIQPAGGPPPRKLSINP